MKIYKPQTVHELEAFYGDLLFKIEKFKSIKDHLEALAVRMWEGVKAKNNAVFNEISNYHWDHLGKSNETMAGIELTEKDCKKTIANEYGFRRWTEVEHVNTPYDSGFETAVNVMLEGNLEKLKKLISQRPTLVNGKSGYGHNATLLHYAASNGVELWRQKVPLNLPEIVAFLISEGANKKAKMIVYNGEYTAAELLPSSVHPKEAGVFSELRKHFED